jgi:hypothetical protein
MFHDKSHHPNRASTRRAAGRALAGAVPAVVAVIAFTAAPAGAQTANGGRPPFASGMLQSISGSTLQVDGFNGTTSVVVTKSTKYTQTKSVTSSAITTNDCVRVVGTGSDSAGIQANTVAVSSPSSKGCTLGQFGGRGAGSGNGQRPDFRGNGATGNGATGNAGTGGNDTTRPSLPANGGTRPANFGTAFGTVKGVSGDQLVVKATVVTGTPKAGKKPKTKTENVDVTLTDATTVTQTSSATFEALNVGSCVTALGTVDSVGTVTANNVMLSQPQNGSCSRLGGFGGGGFGGRFGGGTNGQGGGTTT